MNQLQQPRNLQEERCESQSQERNCQVLKSLCELQHLLMKYLFLNYQRRMKPSQAISFIQKQKIETWKSLNWENPRKVEYESVREIVKQQKELLQQDVVQGRDTSVNQLLLDLLRYLWKYFLFNSRRREVLSSNFTRVDQHREWREFDQALPLLSANLQQNNVHERGATFKQHVKIVLQYLKQSTPGRKAQYSQSTRYNEDQEFDILNAHPVL